MFTDFSVLIHSFIEPFRKCCRWIPKGCIFIPTLTPGSAYFPGDQDKTAVLHNATHSNVYAKARRA